MGRTVGPLSVLDDHSRYAIALGNRIDASRGVRDRLEGVFQRSGVPEGC